MNYYKFNIGDYAAATRHLTMLEHGAYRLLLDFYYTSESLLPADLKVVARKAGARSKEEVQAVETVVKEFFTLTENGWSHTRCDAEIRIFQSKIETNRVVGRLGGRPKKETHTVSENNPEITHTVSENNPEITLTNNHKPITNTPKPPAKTLGANERFERFWLAYPRKVGKDAARRAFDKRKPDDELLSRMLAKVREQAGSVDWIKDGGQFVPHPATWINQGRWQDEGGVDADTMPEWMYGAIGMQKRPQNASYQPEPTPEWMRGAV
jgi:uncharacterized protein YdaU (DUF1376 family)